MDKLCSVGQLVHINRFYEKFSLYNIPFFELNFKEHVHTKFVLNLFSPCNSATNKSVFCISDYVQMNCMRRYCTCMGFHVTYATVAVYHNIRPTAHILRLWTITKPNVKAHVSLQLTTRKLIVPVWGCL